ncbi:ABC-type transport auxiliary lipoprotein family protein [Fibrobacter sp. UWB11]|uniref:ABC-type transport auxiliary lipoprotein family protein n=1 Tax=Fibrobacter sp. UWB11 TaxID=1896202 RepID=UPI0009271C97|nr:ABC-type transport auxiliary lipoprotein family protein [Fibrobacter sp. UWB11]SIN87055.1 ABC-type transport auxiliary lipoprotein component [Fibrobacter sp. UWB11]
MKANRLLAVAALLSAFTLTGCLGGSTEPSRYYTISAESISTSGAASDARVLVKKFTIDPAYQRSNIVYRESPYDFMFYDLDLWATRPEQMLTQVTGEYLVKSNLFKSVDLKPMGKPDFELLGNVDAIEEIDEGSSQDAHLAVQLTFRKVGEDAPLWEKRYDERQSMNKRDAHSAAEALSKLYAKYMQDALSNIANVK